MSDAAINDFAAAVRKDRRANPPMAGDGTALELLLAPRFQTLVESLLAARLPLAPRVLPEYRKGGIGRPDLAFPGKASPPAHAARLVRVVVADLCRAGAPPVLAELRAEFCKTLFAHAAAGGYDTADEEALFANPFTQTLAFGLLLARAAAAIRAAREKRPVPDVDSDAYRLLPDQPYPLFRATLRALMQDEILDLHGAAFNVMPDAVNVVDPSLVTRRGEVDPIPYFYEDFLVAFHPAAKKRMGVYYTPVPVVQYMVAAVDRALPGALNTKGLLDPKVLPLDLACGTGTFLIALLLAASNAVCAEYGCGSVAAEVAA